MSRGALLARTVAAFLFVVASNSVLAESAYPRFMAGIELGGGVLEREITERRTDTKLYLAFRGGYRPSQRLLIGIEIGGFTIQGGSRWEPDKGAGISQRFLITQYQLQPSLEGWYLKGGAGHIRYWDNRVGSIEDDGYGWLAGIGHERSFNNLGRFGPVLLYSHGNSGRIDHRGWALALSWSYP